MLYNSFFIVEAHQEVKAKSAWVQVAQVALLN